MIEGYITPRQLVIGVFVGTGLAGVFFALYALLSSARWYQEMGDWLGSHPIVFTVIVVLSLAIEGGIALFIRARRRAEEEDNEEDE